MISPIITYQNEDQKLPPYLEERLLPNLVYFQTWKDSQMTHHVQLIKKWEVEKLRLCNWGYS